MKNGNCIECDKPLFDQKKSSGKLCDECYEQDDGLETRSITTNEEARAIIEQMKKAYKEANNL